MPEPTVDDSSDIKHRSWWRPFNEEATNCLTIGHTTLHRGREGDEFTLGVYRDLSADGARVAFDELDDVESVESRRYVSARSDATLTVLPRLLARSVVAQPRAALVLPPNEEMSVFVTTPVCAELFLNGHRVDEFSIWDSRLTWFGQSPASGELCFASQTRGARSLAELSLPATRAATEVRVHNGSDSAFSIEKLRLPIPRLSLGWSSEADSLVTERVSFRRQPDGMADVRIEPLDAHARVAPARVASPPAWRNALGALWA